MPPKHEQRMTYVPTYTFRDKLGIPAACLAAVVLGGLLLRQATLPARVDAQEKATQELRDSDRRKTEEILGLRGAMDLLRMENQSNWRRNDENYKNISETLQAIKAGFDLNRDQTRLQEGRISSSYEKAANALSKTDEFEARLRDVEIRNGKGDK